MDSEGDAKFCEKSDGVLCLRDVDFEFAVPKVPLHVGAQWKYNGIDYRIVGKGRRELLGKTYSIYFVDSIFEKKQMRFLFSTDSGLIAITTLDPAGLLLILDGACGFGASANCRR